MTAGSGGSGGPVDFTVDLEQLGALRSKVNEIQRDLLDSHARSLGSATDTGGGVETYGSPDVSRGVGGFITNWQYGRDVITGELDDVQLVIQSAIEDYTKAEESLRQATGGPSSVA
jgi:hypothetical protein